MKTTKRSRRIFDPQQKITAVLSIWTERRTTAQVCQEMEISPTLLGQWQNLAIEGMLKARDEVIENPLLSAILETGDNRSVNRILFNTDRLTNIGLEIMLPVVERAREKGELKTEMNFEMLVEWIIRMLISLITIPSPQLKSRRAMRRMLRAALLPVLEG